MEVVLFWEGGRGRDDGGETCLVVHEVCVGWDIDLVVWAGQGVCGLEE